MKLANLIAPRFKETPAECQIPSHILMMRGGYIKNTGNGIYSLFMPAKRVVQKIENIIREEMDGIGGQEVLLPVALPASLWKESGRFDSVGSELLRFKDRGGADMVLGMTHEEAVVHLARNAAQSYADYPFMLYQIQTKFRDEPRARGGLIRVREFTMKDAYSFHTSQEDLEEYYQKCHKAYERIFRRVGIPEVISVQSDSGMMGGKIAHEFMLITESGEDTLVVCDNCDYRSNMEVAECIVENPAFEESELVLTETPNVKTIEDVCAFFKTTPDKTCKAVIYRKNSDNGRVIVFIRGDLEVNEVKLRNFLKAEIHPDDSEDENIAYGFIGPIGFKEKATMLHDDSLKTAGNLICGANKPGYHYAGYAPDKTAEFNDFAKTYAGAICPKCGKPAVKITRGIEVGNIFQLGTKYTEAMGMRYSDKDGETRTPIMGCYGIGVGRLAASVCEARHDEYGPIWPISIAPWQVHICAIRYDDPKVAEAADKVYSDLMSAGVEVIFDDRLVSAGVMFSDADLLGCPLRVIVSPKTVSRGAAELTARDKSFKEDLPIENAADPIKDRIKALLSGSVG